MSYRENPFVVVFGQQSGVIYLAEGEKPSINDTVLISGAPFNVAGVRRHAVMNGSAPKPTELILATPYTVLLQEGQVYLKTFETATTVNTRMTPTSNLREWAKKAATEVTLQPPYKPIDKEKSVLETADLTEIKRIISALEKQVHLPQECLDEYEKVHKNPEHLTVP